MKSKGNNFDLVITKAEKDANLFNLRCLALLSFLALITDILNEFGVFKLPMMMMRSSAFVGMASFLTPIVIYVLSDHIFMSKPSVLVRPHFKYLLISFAYFGIALLSVSLAFHAIVLLAIPPLISAQYRRNRAVVFFTVAATIILVPISVYGSFFFGALDRNLLKGLLTDEEAMVFANRLAIATPERMVDLLLHYTVPRVFGVVAVIILANGIIRRNGKIIAEQASLSDKIQEDIERINTIQSQVIDALATLIETRDEETGAHVVRTKQYVRMIASELQKSEKYSSVLTDEVIDTICSAAPLHDIGKIAISDTILLKPGKLTKEEFDIMKTHTVKGCSMIKTTFASMDDPKFIKTAEEIALSHHEKWDGSGYPYGLKGEDIPLSARIMAVADVFDALTSVRVYKGAVSPEEALEIMFADSGTHFDPSVMQAVDRLREEIIAVAKTPISEIQTD